MVPFFGIATVMDRIRELVAVARFVTNQIEASDHPFELRVNIGLVAGDITNTNEGIASVP